MESLKVILVDDEPLALTQLQMMLERIGGVKVAGAYLDPFLAIQEVKKICPEVVFLDINMPGIDGLAAGEQIQAILPDVEIVFVTAYNQYAIQAFNANAIDYLMKPLLEERLYKTVLRLTKRLLPLSSGIEQSLAEGPLLCLFQQVSIQLPGQEPERMKWRTTKAQELFAFLLHQRGRSVSKDRLLELLWPDFDISRGMQQLYTTIYHIKQKLKSYGLEELSIQSTSLADGYVLEIRETRIDVNEWEQRLKRLTPLSLINLFEHEEVLRRYEGDYLGEYDFHWAEHERERLRRLWREHALNLADFYLVSGMYDNVIDVHYRIQQVDPVCEESYFSLMKLYASRNDRISVEVQYQALVEMLKKEIDSTPIDEIMEWYQGWKDVNKDSLMNAL